MIDFKENGARVGRYGTGTRSSSPGNNEQDRRS